jgi:arylsulfatase A-like enzyme
MVKAMHSIVFALGLWLSTWATVWGGGSECRPPNIVIFLADDLGYGDVGYHGSAIQTPRIDELASNGLRLEQHYVWPVCTPTRAALLTGRYPSRFGCTDASSDRILPFETVTLASALKAGGYRTALTGKWHLGSLPQWGPNRFGFDLGYGCLGGSVGPYNHRQGLTRQTWHRNGQFVREDGHATDLIAREAARFIIESGDQPFFLYVPFTTPHVPIDETPNWLAANRLIAEPGKRLYAACVTHMDFAIGLIMQTLTKQQVINDTVVIFMSDNGAHKQLSNESPSFPRLYPAVFVGGNNQPFRGFKRQLYEGGIRTPAVVCWPGQLKPRRVDDPIHAVDWMPTLCSLAKVKPPRDLRWDGRNIWPVLVGQSAAAPRTLYWRGPDQSAAIRVDDWKLVESVAGKTELFNIAADPGETTNLALQQPFRVLDLRKRMFECASRDNDARP